MQFISVNQGSRFLFFLSHKYIAYADSNFLAIQVLQWKNKPLNEIEFAIVQVTS